MNHGPFIAPRGKNDPEPRSELDVSAPLPVAEKRALARQSFDVLRMASEVEPALECPTWSSDLKIAAEGGDPGRGAIFVGAVYLQSIRLGHEA